VVERLAQDLRLEYPDVTGFSPQNLWLMRQFYTEFEGSPILQQLAGELPWGHNIIIMQRVKDKAARLYYLDAAGRFGWTRNVLLNQIKADAYGYSLANKTHNFPAALPTHQAEQAEEALKSRYSLEFLGIAGRVHERELERRLVSRLRDFLVACVLNRIAWKWNSA
jgi:predicted nuclease of restriction endonuclease-like (RecB) superfamily